MRGQIVKGLAMLTLLLTLALGTAVATANGQSKHKVTACVPFEFVVGEETFATGQWITIDDIAGYALRIRALTE